MAASSKVRQPSDLPFGSEFSPSQVDLPNVLELAASHPGNWRGLEAALHRAFFHNHTGGAGLANNCRLGMRAYGIIDQEGSLTKFGAILHGLRQHESELYRTLARHILRNRHGMSLIQCIRDMTAAGEEVSLNTLRPALAARGVHYPRGGKHPSIMRLWLAEAGVFVGSRWQVDDQRLKDVLGAEPDTHDTLRSLTREQRAFLRALMNTGTAEPQAANEVARLATATYGVTFPEKSLPKLVLNALQAGGFIIATKTTAGRGAKPFLIAPTAKADAAVIGPLLGQLEKQTDPKVIELMQRSLAEILTAIADPAPHVRGLALEALAFKLMRLLDMDYLATRLRGSATGGAEVDLIFQAARLVFSRWQVQCKNTARVSVDDVAKEVGLTHALKSSVIVIVTTGEVGTEARRFANKVMADSNLAIVMVDRAALAAIHANPAAITDVFRREAEHAMTLKVLDL